MKSVLTMTASDPLFREWNRLLSSRAAVLNPSIAWDTRWICDLPEPERLAMVAELDEAVGEAWEEMSR